ncbi:ABC transporter ATP-binding protein [Clostridium grantii]|uniref:Putative ABC transport system ATP-binding protein n=1 Tax=Clostridium grantii DSM 8605 TaxID=1121316 RepID=A0A1M5WCG0_9CLOT|nr:ABC transporter ATP-binding protein [Clostridium grantii]SHH85140.1 putative ABC transport system ATP-binding protein [Clostridium grantii DSM 8605]
MSDTIFELNNINYGYVDGGKKRVILDDLSYEFERGKFYTILGPSGSGKSTLLAIACALDPPEKGVVKYEGEDIRKMGLTKFRRNKIAIVFQKYNLMDYLTGVENVESDMLIVDKKINGDKKQIAYKILEKVGIVKSKADRRVTTLSGGEQQRVAVGRALAKDVDLILGDEPTGALDTATEKEVIQLLKTLAHEYNKTIILVTHSDDVAKESDVKLRLKDGKLFQDKN